MKKALIVVDMQNDFITGSLGTKEAEAIVAAVAEKIKSRRESGFDIYFTRDTHPENYLQTIEGEHLPVEHCIEGSDGWQIHPAIQSVLKCSDVILDKPTFGSVKLGELIRDGGYTHAELCGLCTDICVISNCAVVKAFCPEIEISLDTSCVAGVTPKSNQNALETLKMLQVDLIN